MCKKLINKFLLYNRELFFKKISPKFRVDALKNLMDLIYVLFEKIAFSFEVLSIQYLQFYEELVEKEVKIAGVTLKDKVLVIGCGSIPATPILIANKTRAQIVSIDVDEKAVYNASRFIKHQHLESLIKCEQADGLSCPLGIYDVIFILYGIKQQREILTYVSKNMKENARVIYRTTDDVFEKIVGGRSFLSKLFIIRDCVHSDVIPQNNSYLLLKRKQ